MFSVQCINHNVEIILDLSDDLPRRVKGDSARVVQIFTNLISNSIKFTQEGHIILRGWSQSIDGSTANDVLRRKSTEITGCGKDDKITLWFEVEDTGCGIDSSKWESVFESFEQADPSTTRKHGGTGLGLCIVRNLVNKMGGEIKVAKNEGSGTLMQLYMTLGIPEGDTGKHIQAQFSKHDLVVLLALKGKMGRFITSQWLNMNGVFTCEASEWNKLTQILKGVFKEKHATIIETGHSTCSNLNRAQSMNNKSSTLKAQNMNTKSSILIVVDASLLDQSTNIWNEQLIFLEGYCKKAKFAWILSHDTSNAIKSELRKRGHFLTVNKPLYKTKMLHILESVINDECVENSAMLEDMHECNEIDPIYFEDISSDESSDNERLDTVNNEIKEAVPKLLTGSKQDKMKLKGGKLLQIGTHLGKLNDTSTEMNQHTEKKGYPSNMVNTEEGIEASRRITPEKGALDGIYILLAEDNPILQKVATKMLEKMGATVVAVGDGMQAVDALKCMLFGEASPENILQQGSERTRVQQVKYFDMILMDCQMPKLDGYEATKAIRRLEAGTNSHVPIIAVTAHAMSSDEAKCLDVGMDAYMTKPIDWDLMVSNILALVHRNS